MVHYLSLRCIRYAKNVKTSGKIHLLPEPAQFINPDIFHHCDFFIDILKHFMSKETLDNL